MIKVALCGVGYWGRNLLRVLSNNPGIELTAIVDTRYEVREQLAQSFPGVAIYEDASSVILDASIDAMVVATPVSSHYLLAKAALDSGKHVLIEKPMCGSSEEAEDLVARAKAYELTLMVDHTFLFHPAVRKLRELVKSGALGHVSYFDSQRVNLGLFQPDVNVLWDLAPHDLSILDHLFAAEPISVEASGYCHVNENSPDIAYITLHYANSMVAHLNLSWMSPVKMRRIAVGGSKQMVVWDDLNRDEPLKIYDSGITIHSNQDREINLPNYRIGDVSSPRIAGPEPLTEVIEHFRRSILGQERCQTDGEFGLRIVRTLERAQFALERSLQQVAGSKRGSFNIIAAE